VARKKETKTVTVVRHGKTVTMERKKSRRRFGTVDSRKGKDGTITFLASYLDPDGRIDSRGRRVRYYAPQPFLTDGDADIWLGDIEKDIKAVPRRWNPPTACQARILGEYARPWLTTKRKKDGSPLSDRTRNLYTKNIEKDLLPLMDTSISDLTSEVVRNWHHDFSLTNGETSAAIAARCLRDILTQYIEDTHLLDENPVSNSLCNTSSKVKNRPPTDQELATMMDWFEENEPRLLLAMMIPSFGGERLGEWRALRVSDLRLEPTDGQYYVLVARQAQQVKGGWSTSEPKWSKGEKSEVALPDWMTEVVDKHLNGKDEETGIRWVDSEPNSLLFKSSINPDVINRGAGEYISSAWTRAWNAARKAAEIPRHYDPVTGRRYWEVREHDLRGYYATNLIKNGATFREVQGALRHKTPNATLKYIQEVQGANAAVANLLPKPNTSFLNPKNDPDVA